MSIPVKLTCQERERLLRPLLDLGWSKGDHTSPSRDAITKEYLFPDFVHAFGFMGSVAVRAEASNHHPEWYNVYNRVRITWSTHDCAGISQRDIDMANFCDSLYKK